MFNVNFEGIKQTIGSLISESRGQDAIQILTDDHNRVQRNFAEFENADDEKKRTLAAETMLELKLHSKIEELLVYPIIRKEDDELINEAEEEHHLVDLLIAELQVMNLQDSHFDAKFKVLGECVKHHIKEEQDEAFPKLRQSGVDLNELGQEIAQKKEQLMTQFKNMKQFGEKGKKGGSKRGASASSARKAAPKKAAAKGARGSAKTGRAAGGKKAVAKKATSKKATASSSSKRSAAGRKGAAAKSTKRASTSRTAKTTKSASSGSRGKSAAKSKSASLSSRRTTGRKAS